MAGRRILDAAALFNASRAVTSKHVASRAHQLDVFGKTSSLAKAVKGQTDRVTLTVEAASALARRFNEPVSSYSTSTHGPGTDTQGGFVPGKDKVDRVNTKAELKEGLGQDHFYERPDGKSIGDPVPDGELGITQEKAKRYPLPDGSIPPADSDIAVSNSEDDVFSTRPQTQPMKAPLGAERDVVHRRLELESSARSSIPRPSRMGRELSGEEAKISQRQAEAQIPARTAEPPPTRTSASQTGAATYAENAELGIDQEQDVFYSPSTTASPVLSALPRVKVPKFTEDTQESDEHVPDEQINQDVFYSSLRLKPDNSVPQPQAVPEQNQPSEDLYADIFHSPKVAKLLGGHGKGREFSNALELQGAKGTPVDRTKLSENKDQDTFSVRPTAQEAPKPLEPPVLQETGSSTTEAGEEDVHELAADLAKDAQASSSSGAQNQEKLERESLKDPYRMRESRVPSSRLGRLWQYGGLATSMAFGAVGESFRRVTGGAGAGGSLMLSAGNMERLVAKLSRMRGAALKLGQMMSFQDSKMLPAPIQEVLQRVQDSADYMPLSQRDKVLASNLGSDWRELFESFDDMPMAAASIGQVHGAVLKSSGQRVAVKVQYPGVADSIDSDLKNLTILLTASRLLPKGLYLDKTIANARTELAWECDYIREAECGKRFRELLKDEQDIFVVPAIIDEASGAQVLTMERMEGVGVTKVQNFTQEQKDWIGTQILRLCLREIAEFRFMQTDPNWTNFLYNSKTKKLELLDFGASREYPSKFIDPYLRNLLAASRNDRDAVRDLSIQLGYLTGHESQAMLNAHITSVLTLAEPFRDSSLEVYNFQDQTITDRVKSLIPVMMRERLSPPPEETYSLHRKLSGAFLLCARLGSQVRCKEMFARAMEKAGVS